MLIQYLFENPVIFLLISMALVISLTVHEFAHAWVAYRLGDSTPKFQGRVTLNPLAHLDIFGTLALLFLGFGWGKPVEFDIYNLKHPKRDSALIAFAGPLTNLVIGTLFFILGTVSFSELQAIFNMIAYINFILAFFNMIPIYPLDGFNVVTGVLPYKLAVSWRETADYGLFLLLAFIVLQGSRYTVIPMADGFVSVLRYLTNFIF